MSAPTTRSLNHWESLTEELGMVQLSAERAVAFAMFISPSFYRWCENLSVDHFRCPCFREIFAASIGSTAEYEIDLSWIPLEGLRHGFESAVLLSTWTKSQKPFHVTILEQKMEWRDAGHR